jgi:hypothetical protein
MWVCQLMVQLRRRVLACGSDAASVPCTAIRNVFNRAVVHGSRVRF